MIKLLCKNNEPAKVVDTEQKPVLLTRYTERFLEVNLPKLIWAFDRKNFRHLNSCG